MNTYHVKEYAGEGYTYEAGVKLFNAIKPVLLDNTQDPIYIDFSGFWGLSSSFLHGFMANALELVGKEAFRARFRAQHVTSLQATDLKQYFDGFTMPVTQATL